MWQLLLPTALLLLGESERPVQGDAQGAGGSGQEQAPLASAALGSAPGSNHWRCRECWCWWRAIGRQGGQ